MYRMDRMTFRYTKEYGFDNVNVGGVGVACLKILVTSSRHSAMFMYES